VPKNYSEEDLRPLFESVGPVIELVVVRDKFSHESKGSAFVWYRTRADADRACLQLNVRHVLPSPAGEGERPLVVRRANTRKPAAPMAFGAYTQQQQQQQQLPVQQHLAMQQFAAAGPGPQQVAFYSSGGVPMQVAAGGAFQPVILDQQAGGASSSLPSSSMASSTTNLLPVVYQHMMTGAPQQGAQYAVYANDPGAVGGLVPAEWVLQGGGAVLASAGGISGGSALVSTNGNVVSDQSGAMLSRGNAVLRPGADRSGAVHGGGYMGGDPGLSGASNASSGGGGAGGITVQVPLIAEQMAALANHAYSIQMMSGADVTSQAVGPGVFCLMLRGEKIQVETANQMVASVLQNMQ